MKGTIYAWQNMYTYVCIRINIMSTFLSKPLTAEHKKDLKWLQWTDAEIKDYDASKKHLTDKEVTRLENLGWSDLEILLHDANTQRVNRATNKANKATPSNLKDRTLSGTNTSWLPPDTKGPKYINSKGFYSPRRSQREIERDRRWRAALDAHSRGVSLPPPSDEARQPRGERAAHELNDADVIELMKEAQNAPIPDDDDDDL